MSRVPTHATNWRIFFLTFTFITFTYLHPAMDSYRLEILVEGDKSTFLVTIPRTEAVDQLKQLIYEKGKFEGFRRHDLELFKVCHDHNLR